MLCGWGVKAGMVCLQVKLCVTISERFRKCIWYSRLKILGLETLERRRLINDLMPYYKILNGHCNMVMNVALGSSVARGNNFKLVKQTCSIGVRKKFVAIELSRHGIVYLILYSLHHQLLK